MSAGVLLYDALPQSITAAGAGTSTMYGEVTLLSQSKCFCCLIKLEACLDEASELIFVRLCLQKV